MVGRLYVHNAFSAQRLSVGCQEVNLACKIYLLQTVQGTAKKWSLDGSNLYGVSVHCCQFKYLQLQ